MVVAGRKANELGVPVVLDPVGAGATGLRTAASQELLGAVDVAVVRANASEVLALAGGAEATRGVDSVHTAEEVAEVKAEPEAAEAVEPAAEAEPAVEEAEAPVEEPAPAEESSALIAKTRPGLMLLVGYGGFVVIIWLMMFKPF